MRLKEGKTAKITDIPGFLTQCMQSKVKIIYHGYWAIIINVIMVIVVIIIIMIIIMMVRCDRTRTL